VRTGTLLLALVIVAACTRSSPAPVVYGSGSDAQTAKSGPGKTTDAPITGPSYIVNKGDTLFAVSRRAGVPLRDLIEVNGLSPPYRLLIGSRLQIPQLRYHQVSEGETLYAISRQHGVAVSRLVQANNLSQPYTIKVGQRLSLPGRQATLSGPVVAARTLPAPASATKPGRTRSSARTQEGAGRLVYREVRTRDGQWVPLPLFKPSFERETLLAVNRRGKSPKTAVPAPPPRAGRAFAWPAQGRIISRFGAKAGGLHNDGINISLPRGAPVRAAENGVVAYAGNELRGFGNLILLRHGGGWVTAYAHTEKISVDVGQEVRRGQILARAGTSGGVNTPQLHFEIRKGRNAVNPLKHLARGA
jgi:murein DD-endopeptidase MepM/ murein hydrolase activator NlpD